MNDSFRESPNTPFNPSAWVEGKTCPSRDRLEIYIASQIKDPEEIQELERHLGTCEGCSAVIYEACTAWSADDSSSAKNGLGPPQPPRTRRRSKLGPALFGFTTNRQDTRGLVLVAITLLCLVILTHNLLFGPKRPPQAPLPPLPKASQPMLTLTPAQPSISHLLAAADALAAKSDSLTALKTWKDLQAKTQGGRFEGYVDRQVTRYEAIRAEAARRALAGVRERWDDEWRFDFETRKALTALEQYEQDYGDLHQTELESLRRYFRGLEAGPAEFLWRSRLRVRKAEWLPDEGLEISSARAIELADSWFRFTTRDRSELHLRISIPDLPRRSHLRINAAQAIAGRLREGRLMICVNGEVLFGGWRPWAYSWAVYEWPVAKYLKPGINTISLHLTRDSFNQVWLREVSLLGYRDRDDEAEESEKMR